MSDEASHATENLSQGKFAGFVAVNGVDRKSAR